MARTKGLKDFALKALPVYGLCAPSRPAVAGGGRFHRDETLSNGIRPAYRIGRRRAVRWAPDGVSGTGRPSLTVPLARSYMGLTERIRALGAKVPVPGA